ncbi:MAG: cytochrome P450 [Candidatus Binatia bacterium]|nr:cytochrome P450 [Candidatus Binatia bacterium]MDG2008682.1 cytochrome P450 [Candidatus Binatia bacterium]HAC81729.1 cytochrome P450 [Deltaproteobacteria bacterium]
MPSELYYDPYDYAIDANPHPVWQRLREEAPLYYNEKLDFYALSRFDDVWDASIDHDTFSSAHGTVLEVISDNVNYGPMMIWLDPPDHTQLRKLVGRAFTPRRIRSLEERIRELSADYLDPLVEQGRFDFVEDFGARLPVMVIGALLGLPADQQEQVRAWTDSLLHIEPGETQLNVNSQDASKNLRDLFQREITARRKAPRDDLMSDLLASEIELPDGKRRRLNDEELHAFVALLSGAGNETVARLLGWAGVVLAQYPEQRERLIEDPSLIPNGIEELLRYEAPSPIQARYVTRPIVLHGQEVPAGSKMALMTGSAGRDPREYPDPDTFDVGRSFSRHVAFGFGIHFCLGASLARMEGRVALEEALRRFPRWEIDEGGLEMVHTSTVRGYSRVPVSI